MYIIHVLIHTVNNNIHVYSYFKIVQMNIVELEQFNKSYIPFRNKQVLQFSKRNIVAL